MHEIYNTWLCLPRIYSNKRLLQRKLEQLENFNPILQSHNYYMGVWFMTQILRQLLNCYFSGREQRISDKNNSMDAFRARPPQADTYTKIVSSDLTLIFRFFCLGKVIVIVISNQQISGVFRFVFKVVRSYVVGQFCNN